MPLLIVIQYGLTNCNWNKVDIATGLAALLAGCMSLAIVFLGPKALLYYGDQAISNVQLATNLRQK